MNHIVSCEHTYFGTLRLAGEVSNRSLWATLTSLIFDTNLRRRDESIKSKTHTIDMGFILLMFASFIQQKNKRTQRDRWSNFDVFFAFGGVQKAKISGGVLHWFSILALEHPEQRTLVLKVFVFFKTDELSKTSKDLERGPRTWSFHIPAELLKRPGSLLMVPTPFGLAWNTQQLTQRRTVPGAAAYNFWLV